jgi:hypothetical protein
MSKKINKVINLGVAPDDVLMSVYGSLRGLNNMPVTVLEGTRANMRHHYAHLIIERGLVTDCTCEVCEGIRVDNLLWEVANNDL